METSPVRVVIMVQGGVVQAVHTDAKGSIKVTVYDLDAGSFETLAERAARETRVEEYEQAIDGMTEVPFN